MGRNRALGAPYQIRVMTDSFTTEYGVDEYGVDSPSATVTATLDPNGAKGDQVVIRDVGGNAAANPIIVMDGAVVLGVINQDGGSLSLTNYAGAGGTTWGQTGGGTAAGCSQPICNGGNAYGETLVIGSTDDNVVNFTGRGFTATASGGPSLFGLNSSDVGIAGFGVRSTPANPGEPVAVFTNLSSTVGGGVNNAGILIYAGVNNSGDAYSSLLGFQRPDGTVLGTIQQASATSVSYNTTSDARLKENVRPSSRGLEALGRIQVRDYNFIGDTRRQQGVLAQELAEVYPDAVSRGGDDPKTKPWGVDYGRLTPLTILAIQELQQAYEAQGRELEWLRREVAALQSR